MGETCERSPSTGNTFYSKHRSLYFSPMLVCLLVVSNAYAARHEREPREPSQSPRHDVALSSSTAPSWPIRKRLTGTRGPGYLAVTGPSAGEGEATALWCSSLWLRSAARGKSKCWLLYTLHRSVGPTSQSQQSESTDTQMATKTIHGFRLSLCKAALPSW